MANDVHMILFHEHKLDNAAEAITRLRNLGVREKEIAVVSGVPYHERILGRQEPRTIVPYFALVGALAGFATAIMLNVISTWQYPLTVGGFPLIPIPTTIVIIFELTMLGMLLATFFAVFIEMISPSATLKGYHPKISDGYIGILYANPEKMDERIHSSLEELVLSLSHPRRSGSHDQTHCDCTGTAQHAINYWAAFYV
jgi:hypothetical protein